MPLKVLHLSTYAGGGGAARAASNLNKALQSAGVDSRMLTAHGSRFKLARAADRALWNLQRSPVNTWRSPARFGSLSAKAINESKADVVNLHWVTDGFLSIEEIGRIEKPIVMSMYDMWPFCGTEHYGPDLPDSRWRSGYYRDNRPAGESGLDLDRHTWERKVAQWNDFHMVPASSWLADLTRNSALCCHWPTTQIPHCVDDRIFCPVDRDFARRAIGVDPSKPNIGFVSSAGISDPRKGFDLLKEAIVEIRKIIPSVHLTVVGPRPAQDSEHVFNGVSFTGPITKDADLVLAYSAMDALAVPSRQDNMPLTAMESQMCGVPVVGFRAGGMVDLVQSGSTGYLCESGSVRALSESLLEALFRRSTDSAWSKQIRDRSVQAWGLSTVACSYQQTYEKVMTLS